VTLLTFSRWKCYSLKYVDGIFFQKLLFETFNSIGLNMMIFIVIPKLDPVSGLLMTNCIGLVPAMLKVNHRCKFEIDSSNYTCLKMRYRNRRSIKLLAKANLVLISFSLKKGFNVFTNTLTIILFYICFVS
jgi:hypothetical protein